MSTPFEQWQAEQVADRLAKLRQRMPKAYQTKGFLEPAVAEWATRVAAGRYGNLALVGSLGVGKSWSLWHAAEIIVGAGFRGRIEIVPARRLQRLITPPVDWAALDRLAAAGVLAIDDVGSVRIGDWDSDQMGALLDPRWEGQRPTILTSNQLDLRTLVGERTASRLAHNVTVVQIAGQDRRRAA